MWWTEGANPAFLVMAVLRKVSNLQGPFFRPIEGDIPPKHSQTIVLYGTSTVPTHVAIE